MIDIQNETLRSLREASERLPGRPHVGTVVRWHREGVSGVRLETVVVGARRFTSDQALERFVERTTQAHDLTRRKA